MDSNSQVFKVMITAKIQQSKLKSHFSQTVCFSPTLLKPPAPAPSLFLKCFTSRPCARMNAALSPTECVCTRTLIHLHQDMTLAVADTVQCWLERREGSRVSQVCRYLQTQVPAGRLSNSLGKWQGWQVAFWEQFQVYRNMNKAQRVPLYPFIAFFPSFSY